MKNIFKKLFSTPIPVSNWREKVKFRRDNKFWLKDSANIALTILFRLDELGYNKQNLSDRTGIPKKIVDQMVKGSHNFTLKELKQLEISLDTKIIKVYEGFD